MIKLDIKSSKPLYEQIIEQIKYHVIKGYLKPGDPIPSVRRLAIELKITPSTVAKAYQELERQKVIETIRAQGTFIAESVSLKPDEEKLEAIRKEITSLMMELKLMGFSRQDAVKMVSEQYNSLK